jgi:16S rRNA (guanine1516-N2)-methyltransferase
MLDMIPVWAQTAEDWPRAVALAARLHSQAVGSPASHGLFLRVGRDGLDLCDADAPRDEPLRIDFSHGSLGFRQRVGFRRDELLARAVGVKGSPLPRVLDATAGLGRDAFMLASLGCDATLCERNPLVHALLADGLHRAEEEGERAICEAVSRMRLLAEDAAEHLSLCIAGPADTCNYDVIVLDPMFPERTKSALVKKPMRLFRALVGADDDADALLHLSLECAGKRVVVKRPLHAPHLAGCKPTLDFRGKAVRFDVYVKQARASLSRV